MTGQLNQTGRPGVASRAVVTAITILPGGVAYSDPVVRSLVLATSDRSQTPLGAALELGREGQGCTAVRSDPLLTLTTQHGTIAPPRARLS